MEYVIGNRTLTRPDGTVIPMDVRYDISSDGHRRIMDGSPPNWSATIDEAQQPCDIAALDIAVQAAPETVGLAQAQAEGFVALTVDGVAYALFLLPQTDQEPVDDAPEVFLLAGGCEMTLSMTGAAVTIEVHAPGGAVLSTTVYPLA